MPLLLHLAAVVSLAAATNAAGTPGAPVQKALDAAVKAGDSTFNLPAGDVSRCASRRAAPRPFCHQCCHLLLSPGDRHSPKPCPARR